MRLKGPGSPDSRTAVMSSMLDNSQEMYCEQKKIQRELLARIDELEKQIREIEDE